MAEWVYRATVKLANQDATESILSNHNFLSRIAFAKVEDRLQAIANVSNVNFGDSIHLIFSTDGHLQYLCSLEIIDEPHPCSDTRVTFGGNPHSPMFIVRPDTPLANDLAEAEYEVDPILKRYTGWHVRVIQDPVPPLVPNKSMFPGHGTLHRYQAQTQINPVPQPLVQADIDQPPSATAVQANKGFQFSRDRQYLGIDWSGAARSGNKIWAALVKTNSNGVPVLQRVWRPFINCTPVQVVRQFGPWLNKTEFHVAAADFCFGLASHHQAVGMPLNRVPPGLATWVRENYGNEPLQFKNALAPELRRVTDSICSSPFAPTNLRMFRQTFWGIRSLEGLEIDILPWGNVTANKILIETLPAMLVRRLIKGPCQYKQAGQPGNEQRASLLRALIQATKLEITEADKTLVVQDREGDAMDAILAAIAAGSAHQHGFQIMQNHQQQALLEGWIYT